MYLLMYVKIKIFNCWSSDRHNSIEKYSVGDTLVVSSGVIVRWDINFKQSISENKLI